MKRKFFMMILVFTLGFSITVSAFPNKSKSINMSVYPPTESTINGIPESQLISPKVVFPWIFDYYDPDNNSVNQKFKEIVQFNHDNTGNSTIYNMTVTVSSSESQGSEWSGNVEFTASVKAGIFAGVEAQTGTGYKEYRSTNEAVGVSGSMDVLPGKYGHIRFWYEGETTDGTLVYYRYNDYTEEKEYMYKDVDATFYSSDYLDVFSEAWQDDSPY